MNSRLAIFIFYDQEGLVDEYIIYYLKELRKNCNRIIFVVNGNISTSCQQNVYHYVDDVVIRDNKGLDAGAWKYVLTEFLSWGDVEQYDELLLINDSVYGPLYPLSMVFERMSDKSIDFWGITKHAESKVYSEHIQAYFMVFKHNVIISKTFREYWEKMPYYQTYDDVIDNHETIITKILVKNGFKWSTLINTDDLDEMYGANCHYGYYQYGLMQRGFPFFKRKNLIFEQNHLAIFHYDNWECIKYIERQTEYDAQLIYRNAYRLYGNKIDYLFTNYYLIDDNVGANGQRLNKAYLVVLSDSNNWRLIEKYYSSIDRNCLFIILLKNEMINVDSGTVLYVDEKEKWIKLSDVMSNTSIVSIFDDRILFGHENNMLHIVLSSLFENYLSSEQFIRGVEETFMNNSNLEVLVPPYVRNYESSEARKQQYIVPNWIRSDRLLKTIGGNDCASDLKMVSKEICECAHSISLSKRYAEFLISKNSFNEMDNPFSYDPVLIKEYLFIRNKVGRFVPKKLYKIVKKLVIK